MTDHRDAYRKPMLILIGLLAAALLALLLGGWIL